MSIPPLIQTASVPQAAGKRILSKLRSVDSRVAPLAGAVLAGAVTVAMGYALYSRWHSPAQLPAAPDPTSGRSAPQAPLDHNFSVSSVGGFQAVKVLPQDANDCGFHTFKNGLCMLKMCRDKQAPFLDPGFYQTVREFMNGQPGQDATLVDLYQAYLRLRDSEPADITPELREFALLLRQPGHTMSFLNLEDAGSLARGGRAELLILEDQLGAIRQLMRIHELLQAGRSDQPECHVLCVGTWGHWTSIAYHSDSDGVHVYGSDSQAPDFADGAEYNYTGLNTFLRDSLAPDRLYRTAVGEQLRRWADCFTKAGQLKVGEDASGLIESPGILDKHLLRMERAADFMESLDLLSVAQPPQEWTRHLRRLRRLCAGARALYEQSDAPKEELLRRLQLVEQRVARQFG